MKRNCRNLEHESNQQKANPSEHRDRVSDRSHCEFIQVHRTRFSVEKSHSIQEESGRKGSKNEILQGRLNRLRAPNQSGKDVQGN